MTGWPRFRFENRRLSLSIPIAILIVAFTAIPLDVRQVNSELIADAFSLPQDGSILFDVLSNIVGFIPIGIVFARWGILRALIAGAALSASVECCQLFSDGRSPSIIDLGSNVLGTAVGLILCVRYYPHWFGRPPAIEIGPILTCVALALALGLAANNVSPAALTPRVALSVLSTLWPATNPRGNTSEGRLEAHWTFDEKAGATVVDSSLNGIDGALVNEPARIEGILDDAVLLDGEDQYMAVGDPTELRLEGSMTLSAWINPSGFPPDDAAVVSNHTGLGYQLDTTVDEGARTIGFKLAGARGQIMVRYGKTPLVTDTWYHIAGVYDSQAKSMDVYLNGRADNGCLLGTVTSRQLISGREVFVGRRGDLVGTEFAGAIDDVRVYSRALSAQDIEAMAGSAIAIPSARALAVNQSTEGRLELNSGNASCSQSLPVDSTAIGLFVALGLLVAIACAGFWPTSNYRLPCLAASFVVGLFLFPLDAPNLLNGNQWLAPILTLMGGFGVVTSIRIEGRS